MANGQEQQSVVTGQQTAVNQQQQPANLYQAIGSLNPQQLLQLKSNVQKRAGRREIYRNVGGDRGAQLISSVEQGEMSISDAIARSKTELTPNMQSIDSAYFTKDATAASMLPLKERMKNTWNRTERNLWLSHYNSLKSQELKADNKRIKKDKSISVENRKRFDHYAKQFDFKQKAQVDYIDLQTILESAGEEFDATGVDPDFNTAYNALMGEIGKDLGADPNAAGDQYEMQKKAIVIANTVPLAFLDRQKGYMIGGEWIETPEKTVDERTKRRLFAENLIRKIVAAKNHMAEVTEYYEPQQPTEEAPEEAPAEGGGTDWSQYMVE